MVPLSNDSQSPGIGSSIAELLNLAEQTIEAARLGQVVETDLLTMRIGIIAEALCHADRTEATQWLNHLGVLSDRLGELVRTLEEQEAKLKTGMAEKVRRALDAYR